MSKYNKILSIIDSQALTSTDDGQGGVIWPKYTFFYPNPSVSHGTDETTKVYVKEPRFSGRPCFEVNYYGVIHTPQGFKSGVEPISVALFYPNGGKNWEHLMPFWTAETGEVLFNDPNLDQPIKDLLLVVQFNADPFA